MSEPEKPVTPAPEAPEAAGDPASPVKTVAIGADGSEVQRVGGLPGWLPAWADELAELYFSGTTTMFVLHGNTVDFARIGEGEAARYGRLSELLAEQLFGRWDVVLRYDLARGLRCMAGADAERLRTMVETVNRKIGDIRSMKRDPTLALAVLDRFVEKNVMAEPDDRLSVAIVLDHASFVAPRSDRADTRVSTHLVTLLNWASSPYVKRLNMAFVLVDQRLADLSERLTSNPHVATIGVPLPDEDERVRFLDWLVAERDPSTFSDYGTAEIARLTAGISLTDLEVLVRSSIEGGRRLSRERFSELKKRLIERQAQGLIEFIEPRWGLDMVVGHVAAKKRLLDDAELLSRGALDTVPMGYLICGPVGTGKSFLAQCAAGSIGIPCVKLKNFRSKFVGETEGNLERVLGVLRSMGPVVVIVDEADAMLGDRKQGGDAGVSSRVFGMIAAQMGNTAYRGRIVWMLLTARPDYLPIDLKRQGRAEVHIPLFYPYEQEEIRDLFVVMAKKNGAALDPEDVPPVPHRGKLSGADVEGLVNRAWRRTLLDGGTQISREALQGVIESFLPSTQGAEKELQEIAAAIECTDREFLPPSIIHRLRTLGGREKLEEHLARLKRIIED